MGKMDMWDWEHFIKSSSIDGRSKGSMLEPKMLVN